jgi:hypothetical protein
VKFFFLRNFTGGEVSFFVEELHWGEGLFFKKKFTDKKGFKDTRKE